MPKAILQKLSVAELKQELQRRERNTGRQRRNAQQAKACNTQPEAQPKDPDGNIG